MDSFLHDTRHDGGVNTDAVCNVGGMTSARSGLGTMWENDGLKREEPPPDVGKESARPPGQWANPKHADAAKPPPERTCVSDPMTLDTLPQMIADMLPADYFFDTDRQVIGTWDKDGVAQDICGPLAAIRSVHDTDRANWAREIIFVDRGGKLQTMTVPEKDLIVDTIVAKRFVSRGLALHAPPRVFANLIRMWKTDDTAVMLKRQGWADSQYPVFLHPQGMLISPYPNLTARDFVGKVATSDFETEAAAACAELRPLVSGNSLAIMAICVGLAGPVVGLVKGPGFGLHLAGPSGIGKSTIARLAQCVWSSEAMGTGEATAAAYLAALAKAHHGLAVFDEVRPRKGQGEIAYSIGNGVGRARANARGELMEPTRTLGIVLTTGEISAADIIEGAGDQVHDGQMVRHLTLPLVGLDHGIFDHLNGFANFEDLAAAILKTGASQAGILALRFITCLCRQSDAIVPQLDAMVSENHDDLIARLDSPGRRNDPKSRRVLRNFAVLLTVGILAERMGLACWEKGELAIAIVEVARRALLFLRKPDLFSELASADPEVRNVRRQILMHVDRLCGQLDIKGERTSLAENRIIGWMDETRLHLPHQTLVQVFGNDTDAKSAIHTLRGAGDLLLGDGRHVARKLPTWTGQSGRAICIDRTALGL